MKNCNSIRQNVCRKNVVDEKEKNCQKVVDQTERDVHIEGGYFRIRSSKKPYWRNNDYKMEIAVYYFKVKGRQEIA